MERNNRWLIALDLDDTFLCSDKSVSNRNRLAVEACLRQGHEVMIASGRPFDALPHNVTGILKEGYAITSNGVAIYRIADRERIFHRPIPRQLAMDILDACEREHAKIEILMDGKGYTFKDYVENPQNYGVEGSSIEYIKRTRTGVEDIYAFARSHAGELDQVDILVCRPEERERYARAMQSLSDVNVTSSMPRLLEIMAAGNGKGCALKGMAELMGIKQEHTMAFGNEINDLDMLLYAGQGIAVANSCEEVLAAADKITASNDEDGVAVILEELLKTEIF